MKKNNTSLYLVAILAVALLIGVGYAALTTTLNINGQTEISKTTWDVHFENVSTNDSDAIKFFAPSDTAMSNPISNISGMNATTLNYKVTLTKPDVDKNTTHDMTVDIVNNGTIDAIISNVSLPDFNRPDNGGHSAILHMTTEECHYTDYVNSSNSIKVGDVIKAGSKRTIICKHHYKSTSELTTNDLAEWNYYPSEETISRDFSLAINFMAK